MKLINILLEYTDKQKQKLGIPAGAVARGGNWYIGDKYVGQVIDGKFVTAQQEPVPTTPKISKTTQQPTNQPAQQPTKPLTPKISKTTQQPTNQPAQQPTKPLTLQQVRALERARKIRDRDSKVGEVWTDDFSSPRVKNSYGKIVAFNKNQLDIAKYYADRSLPRPDSMNMNTPEGFVEQLSMLPTAQSFKNATDIGTVSHSHEIVKQFFPTIGNRYSRTSTILDDIEVAEKKSLKLLKKNKPQFNLVDAWKVSPPSSIKDRKRVSKEFSEFIRTNDLRIPTPELARGMTFSEPALAAKFLQQIQGGVVDLPACSWSSDTVIAGNFANITEQRNNIATNTPDVISVLLKITSSNSKGIQGLQIPSQLHGSHSDEIAGEDEVVTPNGKFRVVNTIVGEKDEFFSPSDEAELYQVHPGTKRPFYMIHLEQIEDVSESINPSSIKQLKNLNVTSTLNLAYLTSNMRHAPTKMKDVRELLTLDSE